MLNKNIRLLTWFNFFTDFRFYAPVAIIYFTRVSGSFALGMSIFSIIMVSSAFFEIPTGVFSDRIGQRKTVIFGAAAAVLCAVFYAIGQSFWILTIGATFEGLSRSFYSGNNDALLLNTLAETGNEKQYYEFLGRTSSMFQVALATSAILGGFLASWSFSLIMWLSVIPQIVCFLISFKLIEPKIHVPEKSSIYHHLKEAFGNFITNKKLRALSLSSILSYGFGESAFQFSPAFFGTLWPVWAIGIARALSNILASFSFHFSGRIIKRFGGIKILIIENIYNRLVNIFSVGFPGILSPLLMTSTSMFFCVATVADNALQQKEFSNHQRATMGSLNSFAGSIFFGIVAILLGLIADKISPAKAILIMEILQFSVLWLYLKLFKSEKIMIKNN